MASRGTITTGFAAALLGLGVFAADVQAAPGVYGCFKVTAASINIRDGAFSSSAVIGTAGKGDILIKRKRFCTLRGFWCAVRKGSIEGWADKAYMQRVDCPERILRDQ